MERIDVVQIQSTSRAFAAIRRDGHVVSWGDPARGGDSRAVQDQNRRDVLNGRAATDGHLMLEQLDTQNCAFNWQSALNFRFFVAGSNKLCLRRISTWPLLSFIPLHVLLSKELSCR